FTFRRVYYSLEFFLFAATYFLVFSGNRLKVIDGLGARSDAIVSLVLITAFIVFHVIARRRLLPRIESYYAPPQDDRKIFFELGPGSQHVATVDQLYQLLAERIRVALDAANAAIFTRDE